MRAFKWLGGGYIAFVDPDDYVEINFIELLVNRILIDGSDLAICGYKRVYYSDDAIVSEEKKSCVEEGCYKDYAGALAVMHKNTLLFGVWNKLFKTEIITKNNIVFPGIIRLEDAEFVYDYLRFCFKISFIQEIPYCYAIYLNGRVTATNKFIKDMFKGIHIPLYMKGLMLLDEFDSRKFSKDGIDAFHQELKSHLVHGAMGDIVVNMALSRYNYSNRVRYIKQTINEFKNLIESDYTSSFTGIVDKLIWFMFKRNAYQLLVILSYIYGWKIN